MKTLKMPVAAILISAFLMPAANTKQRTANAAVGNEKFDVQLLHELECGSAEDLSVLVVFNDFDEEKLNDAFESMYPDEYKTYSDIYEGTAEKLTYADVCRCKGSNSCKKNGRLL